MPMPTTPPASSPAPSSPTPAPTLASPTQPQTPLAGAVIVLDPGHNGSNADHLDEINKLVDAGGFKKPCNNVGTGTASGYLESAFNWDLAKLLATRLRTHGATVILTRKSNDGWGPCIDERGQIAARNDADLLLSIHADGSSAGNRGFHLISPASLTGYTGRTAAPSRRAAVDIRDALVAAGLRPANYAGSKGLIVRSDLGTLNRAETPAVMVECGNMLNAGDAALMTSRAGRSKLAAALADGIARYLT